MKIFSGKQNLNHLQRRVRIAVLCTGVCCCLSFVQAEDPRDVLPPEEWQLVDASVDRGLAYLAAQQAVDGSIASPQTGQPGITSLAVLAFLSRGHVPGEGPYGRPLLNAVDYVQSCQRDDGLLCAAEPENHHVHDGASHTGNYNHAISGLMLTEVYGMLASEHSERAKRTIEQALQFTRSQQTKPKQHRGEQGGWRYLRPRQGWDADISVTSWQLMFYRSSRNAGFDVPAEYAEEAIGYIRRGFDSRQSAFAYNLPGGATLATRGVVGGAVVSLALGGEYWQKFFPPLAGTLMANQSDDGSWDVEADNNGDYFGRTYTTSLAVLALTPAYQLLPIYQR